MNNDISKLSKKRGRPLGSKRRVSETSLATLTQLSTLNLDDERLTHTLAEEKLSPFSSLLRRILHQDRSEIARVAQTLNIAEITVYRWMNGDSMPRAMHLKRLPEVMSEHREDLVAVINQTFPDILDPPSLGVREVKKDIYRRVLEIVANIHESDARYWQVTQAIFEYALLHLDPERRGFALTYASLMPAHEDGIHSLREAAMRGSPPWPFSLESRAYLGSTSLAGTAAILQRLQTWDNIGQDERLQVDIDEFEHSAAACPVMYAGRISGVLIASSARAGFFTDPMACQAIFEFAQLMALGLCDENFYAPSLLHLRPMPEIKWQRAEIGRTYINRVVAHARKHMISRPEAEQYVLSEMELEFEKIGRNLHK